jgi:hypothetical protein
MIRTLPVSELPSVSLDVLRPFLEKADHVDVKTIESDVSLREFVAGAFAYQPNWVTFLYGVRAVVVRLLGMKQEGIPRALKLSPERVPFAPGQAMSFFTVADASEGEYWLASIDDQHLKAALGVTVEPLGNGRRRFHVLTIVHYHNWAGPVYFNLIRPFHHLVVSGMASAGARGVRS